MSILLNDTLGQQDPDPLGQPLSEAFKRQGEFNAAVAEQNLAIIDTIALLAKRRRQRRIQHDVVMLIAGFVIAFVSFTLGAWLG